MSAQVAVVPVRSVRAGLKPVSARAPPSPNSSKVAAKLSRFRQPPPKPEIEVDKTELKKKLTPMQYKVTQEKFTERPFSGEYLKLTEDGRYCCIVCGVEIFSSNTKFDSGCGWPAFSDVIDNKNVIQQADLSHVGGNLLLLALNQDLARTEVACAKCGAHLGHVFDDGPKPTGKRYCVNSASLRFEKEDQNSCDFKSQTVDLKPKCANTAISVENTIMTTKISEPQEYKPTAMGGQTEICQESQSSAQQQSGDANSAKATVVVTKDTTINKKTVSTRNTDSKATQGSTWRVEWRPSRLFSGSSKSTSAGTQQKSGTAVEPVTGASDANNNRITKYESVKPRYLDHLTSTSKQQAEKHTARKLAPTDDKPLLETHL